MSGARAVVHWSKVICKQPENYLGLADYRAHG